VWTSSGWCFWPAHPVLGGEAVPSVLQREEFSWPFLLAAVQFPIIGVDFLRHYGLLVDPAGNRLVDCLTL
jgi:nitrate reductase NapE component